MSILIVRHGETRDNAQRILQVPESPLSDNGLAQAQLLAKRLCKQNIQRIISSDYLRTKQTARCISERLGIGYSLHKELRERHFGDWRGQAYDSFEINPLSENSLPPNGEDIHTFHQRVANAWQLVTDTAAKTEGDLLVITHGLVCRTLIQNHVQLNSLSLPTHWGNTSLSIVDVAPPWQAVRLNCTAHLTDHHPSGAQA